MKNRVRNYGCETGRPDRADLQNPNDQIFKHKVIDEVMFGPLNIGQSNEEALTNAKEMLELVGLPIKRKRIHMI